MAKMKTMILILAAICFAATARAQGDGSIGSAQQVLKDQGFYYGEITGRKDADTTAAIRRYQIRNGLQITGELNAETQKSLGVKLAPAATPRATTAPRTTPPAAATPAPRRAPPDTSDLRDDAPLEDETPRTEEGAFGPPRDGSGYAPGPRGLVPETSGIFDGTPFEVAPPDVQRRVIVGAQALLSRQGYYRSGIDGVYGPGTQFAVRAYQSRLGLIPSGRLDMETLASLGLLPGQRVPGDQRRRRNFRRPRMTTPSGEPIYIPR